MREYIVPPVPLIMTSQIPYYGQKFCYDITRGQPHPKYKANSARTSHIAVWDEISSSLEDELHDVAERGPIDRDGARSTKSNHSISLLDSRPKSEPRQVC